MKLSYQATPRDAAQPPFRLFLSGETYATNRWRGAVLCAVVFAVFAFLGFHSMETVNIAVICIAASAWGAGLFLLTYKGSVRRRIISFVGKELPGSWPRVTMVEVDGGYLYASVSGSKTSYRLADLTNVTETDGFLELWFGQQKLCVVPLRSFESSDEKNAFIAAARI